MTKKIFKNLPCIKLVSDTSDIKLDYTSSLFVDKLYVKSHLGYCYFDNNEVLIETHHSL